MNLKDKDSDIFTQLGLTNREAEVYLTICKLSQATAKIIAKTAQIARAEVYRAIPELQKRGLIKRILTTPVSFRAIPLSEGFSILLQQEREKLKEKQAKTEQFLQNFNQKETPNQEDFQYTYIAGREAGNRKFSRLLESVQISIDGIISWKLLLQGINSHFESYKKSLERGVEIRRVTNIPKGLELPQNIQELKKVGSFEIRNHFAIPKAGIDIFDKKSVNILTVHNSNPAEIEALESIDPGVVELAIDYFELKWQSATTLLRKKTAK